MERGGRAPLFAPGDPVAVLGLGVSGGAAARLVHAMGGDVYASDGFDGPGPSEAAARLRGDGIDAEAGHHDMDRILGARLVVTSPGIAPTTEIRRAVDEAGLPVVAEIEVAYRQLRSRVIGITGTNGKTTTTALCGHLLREAGIDALTAGNIGLPLSEVALREEQPDWVVVELSSFQLADLRAFRPDIGVLLNLAPDHLDRYASLERYYDDKARLFANADETSRWALNGDDDEVRRLSAPAPGRKLFASLAPHDGLGAFPLPDGILAARLEEGADPEPWTRASDLQLVGQHNVMNALLAGLAAALAGCGPRAVGAGLGSFRGLPHRLQPVAEHDGVLWVNDSKGTNVSATRVALGAFDRPLIVLLGGRHKGEPYASLAPLVRENARAIIAYGEAAPKIARELGEVAPFHVASGMVQLVRMARDLARAGDVVLFSPACSSYDMFPNYEERGRAFERAVAAAHGEETS